MSLNFDWVTPLSTRGNGDISSNAVYATKSKAGRKKENGEINYQLRVLIPEQAMKAARFVIGDRAEVGFARDENGRLAIALRRVLSGGYAISPAIGGNTEDAKGRSVRGRVQMTLRDGMPESFCSGEGGYEVDSNGMLIAWEEE